MVAQMEQEEDLMVLEVKEDLEVKEVKVAKEANDEIENVYFD